MPAPRALGLAAVAGAALVAIAAFAQNPPVNRDAQLILEFTRSVQQYLELHQKLEGTLPARPASPTPTQIEAHQDGLARLIKQARGRAQQGELFTREVRAYFRRQIARALAGPDARQLRSSIMDDNPGRIQVGVNDRYPQEAPLASMPPQVLALLPKLPEHLEYRFIGERLILFDVHANLIVDFLNDALPR